MASLQNQSGSTGTGMVRIVPVFPQYLSDSDGGTAVEPQQQEEEAVASAAEGLRQSSSQLPAFSGAFTTAQVRDAFETEQENGSSEETVSVGDVMKSPVFSEDDDDDQSLWIDLGQSPNGSDEQQHNTRSKLGSPLPLGWFTSRRKSHRRASPAPEAELSFDAAVLSVSQEPEIQEEEPALGNGGRRPPKESLIRRETEGEFRLLDRREMNGRLAAGGRFVGVEEEQEDDATSFVGGGPASGEEEERGEEWEQREPEIVCKHLDHVDMMGLNKTTCRLRFLVNWLVTSLLQLRLDGTALVLIYGPKIKFERGAAVAFNVRDATGALVVPETVQRLAEGSGISLAVGFLSHIRQQPEAPATGGKLEGKKKKKSAAVRVEVVTASLGFLTNFEDVYRLWAFVARFLDPSFMQSAAGPPPPGEESSSAAAEV